MTIIKMSMGKRNRKKVGVYTSKRIKSKVKKKTKKKGKRSTKNFVTNKPSKNQNSNGQKKSNQNVSITAKKSQHTCRRYEEFHNNFLNYDQIVAFLGGIQKGKPETVDLVVIGYSGQGKPIYMVLITTDSQCATTPRHATFIEAGLKGDDTFAVSNALYMIDFLSKNPHYVITMDYVIVPCGNPDAYDQFIKSRVKDGITGGVKRTKSHSEVESKKPRLQMTQNKTGPNNNTCHLNSFNGTVEIGGSEYNDCASENIGRTDLKGKRNESRNKIPCEGNSERTKKGSPKGAPQNKAKENREHSDNNFSSKGNEKNKPLSMDLSMNFPVVLGLNDMRCIPTDMFLEKIKIWKENYQCASPETYALVKAINSLQFAIKLLISLQEGGETICYPFGFCPGISEDSNDLNEVAKKGKHAISARNFQCGAIHQIRGLTYGSLIDFVKVDRGSIKYTFIIQVHKKTSKYNEKQELRQLMCYGCEIMKCIKNMSTAVYKFYTNMTGNKTIETVSTKPGIDKRTNF